MSSSRCRRPSAARRRGGAPRRTSGCGSCCGPPSWPTSAPPQIAATISAENGKTITEATVEAGRSGDLIRLSAFEGTQLYGDTLPLDANKGTGFDKIGFTVRQPVGVVVAITPFNFPSLLVLHKIAPALAAGQRRRSSSPPAPPRSPRWRWRRASSTPACPRACCRCSPAPAARWATLLVADPRVRKVSFTGSTGIGERIAARAGVKKLSLELGASCPVVIMPDADIELASERRRDRRLRQRRARCASRCSG